MGDAPRTLSTEDRNRLELFSEREKRIEIETRWQMQNLQRLERERMQLQQDQRAFSFFLRDKYDLKNGDELNPETGEIRVKVLPAEVPSASQ